MQRPLLFMWSPEKRETPKVTSPTRSLIFFFLSIFHTKIQDFFEGIILIPLCINSNAICLFEIQTFGPEANKS